MPPEEITQARRLLIVDDSKVSRMRIRAFFVSHCPAWTIQEAASGDEALHLAVQERPDYVTMDVNMPGMSGLDAAEQIKARHAGAFIAMMTANVQSSTRQRAEQIGVHFFGKPITEDIIAQIVKRFEDEHA